MGLIDIRKLNAEIDQMITNQKIEIKEMKEKRDQEYSEKYLWMVTDLIEMCAVADEFDEDIWVATEINSHYGCPVEKYCIRFERGHHIGVGLQNGVTYLGRFDIDNDYEKEKRRNESRSWGGGLNFSLDDIVKNWALQREKFERRFEEACLNAIRKKVEKANQNWEFARKELDEARL